jgi:hypothetical protein
MSVEGNHNIIRRGSWVAGGAFAAAMVHQFITAPDALADDKHNPLPADTSVIIHDTHVGDPLNRLTNSNQAGSDELATAKPNAVPSSSVVSEPKQEKSHAAPVHADITPEKQTDLFNLPSSKDDSPALSPTEASDMPSPSRVESPAANSAPQNTASEQPKKDRNPDTPAAPAPTTHAPAPVPVPEPAPQPAPITPQQSNPNVPNPSKETPSTPTPSQTTQHSGSSHHSDEGHGPSQKSSKPTPNDTGLFNLPIPGEVAPTPQPAPPPVTVP